LLFDFEEHVAAVIEKSRFLSKVDQVSWQMRSDLANGNFSKGDKFLTVNAVAGKYKVAPGTAHKALKGLVQTGNLASRHGDRYIVNSLPQLDELQGQFGKTTNKKSGKVIAFIVHTNAIHSQSLKIIATINSVCATHGYALDLYLHSRDDIVQQLSKPDIVGIICERDDLLPRISFNKPIIAFGHNINTHDGVIHLTSDAEMAGQKTVKFLKMLGHRRIAVLDAKTNQGMPSTSFITAFLNGFKNGFQLYGIPWDENLIKLDYEIETAICIEKFIAEFKKEKITAVFLPNWPTLMMLLQSLKGYGFRVPEDISIIGYGDSDLTPYLIPKITRFDLGVVDIASRACEIIINQS
jgi:DNA-binding LacI/PurR family transcriptional regulator